MTVDLMPDVESATTLLARLDAAEPLAWGAVTNDARSRDPETRATMLAKRGFRRAAIDWRYAQLESLDTELAALRRQGIVTSAVWAPILIYPGNEGHLDLLFAFIERNKLSIALWSTLMIPYDFDTWDESKKLDRTCAAIGRVADRAAQLGCRVSLYNFDGWFARAASLLKIAARMERPNVGIAYNFQHAQFALDGSVDDIRPLLPWLHAVNLGGVSRPRQRPIAFGEGDLEFSMLTGLIEAGYEGPLGIPCFDGETDAADCLTRNLEGLSYFRRSLQAGSD